MVNFRPIFHQRNTKVHALVDTRGGLFAILLTGGEAHDCPVAERLIAIGKASKRLIGDKAYDSAELRIWLKDRGTKPVIPNRSNRKRGGGTRGLCALIVNSRVR